MSVRRLIVLGGPNGSGKSTFADRNLREFVDAGTFLNADTIAREINSVDVDAAAVEAGRRLLRRRDELVARGASFCIETTLASRTLLRFVRATGAAGYVTRLVFLFTADPVLNEFRVKQRVMECGHNIETVVIHRRHAEGLRLLADYWDACDEAMIYDARDRVLREIVRKDVHGVAHGDPDSRRLLDERIAAVGGRPLRDA